MRNNGGIIGSGSSVRRKGAVPQSSGVWSTNNLRSFEQSGRPTNNVNELVFLGYYENLSSDTTSATQTFSNVSLGPHLQTQKRIIATVGYNQGGGEGNGVGISSATLTIPGAPSQLTAIKKEVATSEQSNQARSAVLYWDIPTSAGDNQTGTINITYNSVFTDTVVTSQGTILGLYYVEDESEIVQTDFHTTVRNDLIGPHTVTYPSPIGYNLVITGIDASNTVTFTGATKDFEYRSGTVIVHAGASSTTTSIGEVSVTPSPNTAYGVTTVVTMNKIIDLESTLTGDGYLAPTGSTTTIPSTADGIEDVSGADFLVAIDIENFTNTDTGVMFEIGGSGDGIVVGSVSGELRVNVGDGGNWTGTANGEASVVSTTMDNYNGQNITLYVGCAQNTTQSLDILRIGVQPNGGHGASTSGHTILGSATGILPSSLYSIGDIGYGQRAVNIADIETDANYAGTITGIRFWAGAGSSIFSENLDADKILFTTQ